MVKWTEEQKAEFAYQLLLSIPTSRSLKVVDRLGPILHRDFFSMLPYELAVYILSHVDVLTLVHVGQISRRWKLICEDQSLWKQLYISKGWQYDKQAISNYINQPTPALPSSLLSPVAPISASSSKRKTKPKSKELKKGGSIESKAVATPTSSNHLTPVPLAITNDTDYDPATLPTMPGAPITSGCLRPIRRPGDIFLRFRQKRHLQHPSPTLASSSLSTPSMSAVSSSTSFMASSSEHSLEQALPQSLSSPISQHQPYPSSSSASSSSSPNGLDASALSFSTPHSASPEQPILSPSSTDSAPILPHRPLSLPSDLGPISPTRGTTSATNKQVVLTPDTASIKRGSKLLLYDTMVNHRNTRHASAALVTTSISQGETSSPSPSPSRIPIDTRLPVTTTPSLSTVPTPIRRSHPSPSYTRISVSSNIRPTSTPQVGSVSLSYLYQRRHQHPSSSQHDRHGSSNKDNQHRLSPNSSSSLVDPTQHRVVERRPFKNRPLSRQHVPYDETTLYHYQEDGDRRYINWKRLYRNRSLIDKRWRDGKYRMRMFPPAAAMSSTTTPITNNTNTSNARLMDTHMDWIYCLQFNSNILVSGSRDRTLKIWDMATAACLHTLHGHSASVLCLQFDDRWIISGSSDTTIIVWDVSTGERIRMLSGHSESVLNLRFAGQRLVSSSKDRTIRVWDLATGSTSQVLRGHRAAVNAVQFKDDMVVSASGDRTIRLWNVATGTSIRTFDSHSRGIACVEFDGDRIVSGSSDQTIKVWDMATGDCLHTLAGHTDLVRTLQMDRLSNRIVSGSYDGSVRIWNMEKGTFSQSLTDKVDGR
ncbi:unnamed protein product [Absidia cylindrospora]